MEGYLDLLDKNNDFGIEFLEAVGSKAMSDTHLHDHYELYYQISGERYFFIKEKFYYIRPGDFVLIDRNVIHKTVSASSSSYKRMLINFKTKYIRDFFRIIPDIDFYNLLNDCSIMRINMKDEKYIQVLLFKMLEEYDKDPVKYKSSLKILLINLLVFLTTCKNIYNTDEGLKYPNAQYNKISKIAEYINANFSSKLTLNTLSDKFNFSTYYLSRSFKEVIGLSFIEYLNLTRIAESKNLIKSSNLSMTEIALEVGFDSSTYFTKVFKSIVGITPLKYKSLHRH